MTVPAMDDPEGPPSPMATVSPTAYEPGYMQGLNPVQREAVEALDGPVLVLAGAGTGKTRVLTTRLAHLLVTRRASPFQVLAVTFTNKAAREMRERVVALTSTPAEGWWMGTFHALAARMLRRHAELAGLKSNFTILDTDDTTRLIKQLLQAANVDAKKWPARDLLATFDRWKDRGLTPDRLRPEDAGGIAGGRAIDLYRAYQERLLALNACDFGDLLLHTITIFQQHPDILETYHKKLRYLLVDEYQDTNTAQYLWLRLLAQGHRNLCCVGDEDQSIYGWRGAEIGNILRFEQDFPGARIIRLEQNYRSSGHILKAASGLIANNRSRLGKTLWTGDEGGEKVEVRFHWDSEEEARWVGEQVETLQKQGVAPGQMAVLVRTGAQTREFEDRFITMGLPYRVLGGPRFYERMEIRDALAYLRVIVQPDDDLAFERVVNVPKRGIGTATVQTLYRYARDEAIPLSEAAWRLSQTDELKPKVRTALRTLMDDFFRWRSLLDHLQHTDLAQQVLDESGYTQMWQTDKSPEAPGRLENLKELINAMAEFETLPGFLEHVALVMESTDAAAGDVVSIMTLHGAKGLEFDTVFLCGWEEGLFPSLRALDETGLAGLEEERRLAYVGITRGRRRVFIGHAGRRRVYGNWMDAIPSRFIGELPEEAIAVIQAAPAFEGGGLTLVGRGGFGAGRQDRRSEREREPNRDEAWRAMRPNWARTAATSSPGAGPAGGRSRREAPLLEATAREVPCDQSPRQARFAKGMRVFHQKFGYGTVQAVEQDKLAVEFDKAGAKRVIEGFVVPADQAG